MRKTEIPPLSSAYVRVSPSPLSRARAPSQSHVLLVKADCWVAKGRDIALTTPSAVMPFGRGWLHVSNVGTHPAQLFPGQPLARASLLTNDEAALMTTLDTHLHDMDEHASEAASAFLADASPLSEKPDAPATISSEHRTRVLDHFDVGCDADQQVDPGLTALLAEFQDVFSLDGTPGHVTSPKMTIDLKPGARVRAMPPRRASPAKRQVMEEVITQLLSWDVIRPSNSSVSHPVLLVVQNGKPRFCVDYRSLNLATVDDKYPLQRIDDLMDALGGSRFFSTLDAVKGYHQLEIAEGSRYLTAFVCPQGLFEYNRVPFGLKGAPAFFQRFMDSLLGGMRWVCALVYLDDVIIFSKTIAAHLLALRTLFTTARRVGLKFAPSKCHFLLRSVKLLGRLVSADGISILEDRALALRLLAEPTTLASLQSALGLFNWYAMFIPRYQELYAAFKHYLHGVTYRKHSPLRKAQFVDKRERGPTAKAISITLSAAEKQAFAELKRRLADAVRIAFPDWSKPFLLYLDSSQSFHAFAVHQQTARLLGPSSAALANAASVAPTEFLPPSLSLADVLAAQRSDPLWSRLRRELDHGAPKANYTLRSDGLLAVTGTGAICLPTSMAHRVLSVAHAAHFGFHRTHLAAVERWFHPRLAELVRAFVSHCPDCVRTTVRPRVGRLADVDWDRATPFAEISLDVVHMPAANLPFSKDRVDGLFVVVDTFSKAVRLAPCPFAVTAEGIVHLLTDTVIKHGWRPTVIVTDSDRKLTGAVMSELADVLGSELRHSPPHHQQANPVERYVQTIVRMLTRFLFEKRHSEWPRALAAVELLMNSTPSTVTGYSPYDLLYVHRPTGFDDPTVPLGVSSVAQRLSFSVARLAQARRELRLSRDAQALAYARHRRPLPEYAVGDLVMIRLSDRPLDAQHLSTKFTAPLDGPYRISKVLSPHRVELELGDDLSISREFSVEQLQPVPRDDADGRPGLRPEEAGESIWEPSYIAEERTSRGRRQYLVKWVGSNRTSWIDAAQLRDDGCTDVIAEWEEFRAQVHWLTPATAYPGSVAPLHSSARLALDRPLRQPVTVESAGSLYEVTEHPIAFCSAPTKERHRHLLGAELEAVGMLWAWNKGKHWFEGSSLVVITDHEPLQGFLTSSSQQEYGPHITAVRALLMPYIHQIRFVHRPGTEHINADALSRLPLDADETQA